LIIVIYAFLENRKTRKRLVSQGRRGSPAYELSNALDVGIIGYLTAGAFLSVAYYPHLYMIIPLSVALRYVSTSEGGVDSGTEAAPSAAGGRHA
jgi:hypothetical protein